jgi:putative tricarboxylic transport membrane protein
MENITLLLHGFAIATSPQNVFAALIGSFLGLIVGAMPGIGSLSGCALLLPLTFKMNPTAAIIMLAGIYYGNMYGGAFSAILLNIPGDSPAIMTALDGYPLTQQGKAGKALFTADLASFIGGTIGIVLLTVLGPVLAFVGLKFGPAEMVSLLLLALTSIGWMLGEDPKGGLISTCLGVLLATVGMDPTTGRGRFTFDSINLLTGINFIPLVIGMFGFSQVIELVLNRQDFSFLGGMKITIKESLLSKKEVLSILPVALRGGVLGTFIGILPGAGATIASFISYMSNKKISKNGESFGKGAVEGVAASEAANNAAAAGAFAPLLSLGIPGSGTAAVLLGGLLLWGLKPGPLLFVQEPNFVWGLIASMYIGNLLCIAIAIAVIPFLVHILRIPAGIMAPIIMTLCIVGSYSVNNSMFDVYVMLIAGTFAYVFQALKYPLAPFLLSFVLTPRLETAFTQAFQISHGSVGIFFTSRISLALLVCLVLMVTFPLLKKYAFHKK